MNREFIELGGSCAVPIPYNVDHQILRTVILPNLSGVLFTGGGLDLIHPTSGVQHAYYLTAKVIYDYSLSQKDLHNKDFILMGVCQGYQLLTMLVAGDIYTLESISITDYSRRSNWNVNP